MQDHLSVGRQCGLDLGRADAVFNSLNKSWRLTQKSLEYGFKNHVSVVLRRRRQSRAAALTVTTITASISGAGSDLPPGSAWKENRNLAPLAANRATTTGSAATPWKARIRATTPTSTTNLAQRQVGSFPASRASRLA